MLERRWLTLVLVVLTAATIGVLAARFRRARLEATEIHGLMVARHEVEVGDVQPDRAALAHLELHNLGSRQLRVDGVFAECGCTTAMLGDKQLPAGGVLRIPVRLDPTALSDAQFRKAVAVRVSGEGVPPRDILFHLGGTINRRAVVAMTPATVNLGRIAPGRTYEAEVFLSGPRNIVEALPSVVDVGAIANRTIDVRYTDGDASPHSRATRLRVTPVPVSPMGPFVLDVTMRFRGSAAYDARVTVKGSIDGSIIATPARLYFTRAEDGSPATNVPVRVEVRSVVGRAINPATIRADLPLVWSIASRSEAGDRILLDVALAPGADAASALATGVLSLSATQDHEDELAIPVTVVSLRPPRGGRASSGGSSPAP